MTHDDFERPLSARVKTKASGLWAGFDGVTAIAWAVGVLLAVGGAWAMLAEDPLGGEPMATAAIERVVAPRAAATAPQAGDEDVAKPASRDGVPIIQPGDPMPKSGPVIIRVPGADDGPASRAQASVPAGEVDKLLLEDSRYGALPRIGADGRRPLDAYARVINAPAGAARIALVVSGLGVGREATLAALRQLPPEVALAFSPYGDDVGELVAKAREKGHEVLLQAPMEPFDYPANDLGPQTLLTGLPASANLERLRWLLGRAEGYVGVAPLGGGRYLETEAALTPIFTELARRGLMFAGDAGTRTNRSGPAAQQAGLTLARATATIDAAADAAAIDAELARLEREAKAGAAAGVVAMGWASAAPLTLKRIEAWRAGLAARGVTLAPVSAVGRMQGPS